MLHNKVLNLNRSLASLNPYFCRSYSLSEKLSNKETKRVGAVITDLAELHNPLHQQLSYAVSEFKNLRLLCDTVGHRIETLAATKPDSVAYKFCLTQQSLTFLEVKQRIDEIAQNLLNMGFRKGDRLDLLLPNIPELNLSLLAAASIGVISVLMNPAYQLVEIEYMLKKTGAKGIIMLDNLKTLKHFDILKQICPELDSSSKGEINSANLPHLKHAIIASNKILKDPNQQFKGTWKFDELEKFNGAKIEKPLVDMDDSLCILFTSGTTGQPKGAVLTHFNAVNTTLMEITVSNLVEHNKIVCCPIPVFHVFGLIVGGITPFIYGSKAVFPSILPDTLALLKAIHNEKCTSIKAAPIIFMDMLNHPERKNYDLSSLKTMLVGASTVPKDLMLKLRQEIPSFESILTGLGMTETT